MPTLQKISQDLGRVEGKIDTFIAQMQAADDRAAKLAERVGKVENRQHWYSGMAAAIGAMLGLATGHKF